MLINRFDRFLSSQETLEKKLFWGVLYFCVFGAFVSTLFTLYEGMGTYSGILCILGTLLFIIIGIIAKKTDKVSACFFAICLILNVVILPPLFFTCGGFESGITFYCFMGMFLCSLYNHKKRRFVLIVISICAYEFTFFLARIYPQWVNVIDKDVAKLDYSVSFFFVILVVYIIVAFLMKAFDNERRQRDLLIKRLDYYSKRDALTGLLNRRYFINYLSKMIWPERKGFYVLMYDIDDFKKVNDVYGHPFGDKVLCSVARACSAERKFSYGECAVRYGGEEFIQLFYAKSLDEAFERANRLRESIAQLTFHDHPEIRITISGGLVDCTSVLFSNQNIMLSTVDKLLYVAKARGKNQICVKE